MLLLDITSNDKGQLYTHKSTLSNGLASPLFTPINHFTHYLIVHQQKALLKHQTYDLQ